LCFLLLYIFSFLYIQTLSKNYNFDGTVFALFLRNSIIIKQPFSFLQYQHLLYQPISYFLYSLSPVKTDILLFLQAENFFISLFTIVIFYFLFKEKTKNSINAFLATTILGLSYIFWFYSVEAEVHMFSLFVISLSLFFLIKGKEKIASILAGVSLLFHVLNLFFVVSLLLFYFFKRRKNFIRNTFLSAIIPFISYSSLFLYLYGKGSLKTFFSVNSFSAFSLPNIRSFFFNFLSYGNLFVNDKKMAFLFLLFFFFSIIITVKKQKENDFLMIFLFWFLFSFVFHLFWEPQNPELKTPIIFFFLLFLFPVSDKKRVRILLPLLLIFSLFITNFPFFKRNSKIENNTNYLIAEEIKNNTPKKSIIIIGGFSKGFIMGKIYIPYFARRKVLVLSKYEHRIDKKETLNIINLLLSMKKTNKIFIINDFFNYKNIQNKFKDKKSFVFFTKAIEKHMFLIKHLKKYSLYEFR
jgi:hypothetical protein